MSESMVIKAISENEHLSFLRVRNIKLSARYNIKSSRYELSCIESVNNTWAKNAPKDSSLSGLKQVMIIVTNEEHINH